MEPRSPATVEKRAKTGVRLPFCGERRRHRELGQVFVALEKAVRGRAAGVHDTLGDALVVEVIDLLAQHEVAASTVGPRRPAFSEFWLSETFTPWLVVSA